MDRILKILKKENGPRASSAPALELNTIIFKHVYWYMQLISGERLQDHWSSGFVMFHRLRRLVASCPALNMRLLPYLPPIPPTHTHTQTRSRLNYSKAMVLHGQCFNASFRHFLGGECNGLLEVWCDTYFTTPPH